MPLLPNYSEKKRIDQQIWNWVLAKLEGKIDEDEENANWVLKLIMKVKKGRCIIGSDPRFERFCYRVTISWTEEREREKGERLHKRKKIKGYMTKKGHNFCKFYKFLIFVTISFFLTFLFTIIESRGGEI